MQIITTDSPMRGLDSCLPQRYSLKSTLTEQLSEKEQYIVEYLDKLEIHMVDPEDHALTYFTDRKKDSCRSWKDGAVSGLLARRCQKQLSLG